MPVLCLTSLASFGDRTGHLCLAFVLPKILDAMPKFISPYEFIDQDTQIFEVLNLHNFNSHMLVGCKLGVKSSYKPHKPNPQNQKLNAQLAINNLVNLQTVT